MAENEIDDGDITSGPTEDDENRDTGGAHGKDSGDEPTEDDENRDTGGAHGKDSGDEA